MGKQLFKSMVCLLLVCVAAGAQTPSTPRAPYVGAVIVDAYSGSVIFEDNPDRLGSPASTLKLMTLLVIQERISAGKIQLSDMVAVSKKAYATGGSQVYLDPRESFSVEEMLYALMIQSANDAAVALAEHVAGSTEEFVKLMNAKAEELGMTSTRFATVNGLPPSPGESPDVTTARDLATLACELCRHEAVFKYTSADYRQLRAGTDRPFDMRTHNPFLKKKVEGCDGFKTGFTNSAGWSIVVTCQRKERRLNIVVLGSEARLLRDAEAEKLLAKGFAMIEDPERQDDGVVRKVGGYTPPPPPPLRLK
ncbi:MAG: D-alanyl-D-alanine carboxypeptidase [Kiritimatiellae bacterium]|nr:D-alanyl-D-alanine carboxypeptidase [Kiritimatiellia bacterium]